MPHVTDGLVEGATLFLLGIFFSLVIRPFVDWILSRILSWAESSQIRTIRQSNNGTAVMQSPTIYINRSIVMQRLQDAVRNGYPTQISSKQG